MPLGIKILAILSWITSAMCVLFAIFAIFGGYAFSTLLGASLSAGLGLGGVLAFIMILFAVLNFFIGRGLWKGQNWARILLIIFLIIGVLLGLLALFGGAYITGILNLVINGLVGWYLLFNKKVKSAFARAK